MEGVEVVEFLVGWCMVKVKVMMLDEEMDVLFFYIICVCIGIGIYVLFSEIVKIDSSFGFVLVCWIDGF